MTLIWAWYIFGAVSALVYKWISYCYLGKKKNKSIKDCTMEWFFEPSMQNGSSWVTTFAFVWACGCSYINRLGWLFDGYLTMIPLVPPFAFLLGSLAEMLAPGLIKWILRKCHIGDDDK